jgi:hypothetical protein
VKFLPWKTRAEREEAAREKYIKGEKSWWMFQLSMDYMYGKVSEQEMCEACVLIRAGVEYVGVARRT